MHLCRSLKCLRNWNQAGAGSNRLLRFSFLFVLLALFVLWPSAQTIDADESDESTDATVDFNADVRPIFNRHCVACHGGVKQAAGLSFLRRTSLLTEADSGEIPVRPGYSKHSEVIRRISADEDLRMPPTDHGPALSENEGSVLRRWIDQGANWQEHWAYIAPVRSAVPAVLGSHLGNGPLGVRPTEEAPYRIYNEIDAFVADRLQREGLPMSSEADRRTWLRRVSFDLTGLPPTPQEVKDFLSDESPQAYEHVVDRLLASAAFGERWAAIWLDLARYADTMGFENDPPRDIWPYRDWLIRAFNADMPFDQFTIKQLAGDLINDPSMDDLIATAFHRNTQTNTEGGTDDEEFRVQAVIDRVNTTWLVWQGTTFGCAQCHSHPFAPIDNSEYYQFLALFNNTLDCDVQQEYPLLEVPLENSQYSLARDLDRRIRQLRLLLFQQFYSAQDDTHWKNLPLDQASISTQGSAQLRIKKVGGHTEVLTEGTIANRPTYTIESQIPSGVTSMTALRMEALPKNLEAALRTPEGGFVLSRIRAHVLPRDDGEPREIGFDAAFADEPEPILDPEDSLSDEGFGWGAYTRLWRPRSAVFMLIEPVEFNPGDRLRLTLQQEVVINASLPMFLHRARFSISDDDRWEQLVADEDFQRRRQELMKLRKQRGIIPHVAVPVIRESPRELGRRTFQFDRGNWLIKGEEVLAGTPSLFSPMPDGAPRNRLTLAQWLVSRENPLTARVAVNRFWGEMFGVGLVETMEDFGSSGSPPSHPELLDFLAVQFQIDFQWSVKRLLREIVLSATYRQDAKTSQELRSRDPANRLLARGPRNRLTAEMVRDQALTVSGLLSPKKYGVPVMPPQPEGIWRSAYNFRDWKAAKGKDRYRRGIYTYWKRTSGYPAFMAFDMPSREVCTARRMPTNTPLQALATMNDEAQFECALALADRMKQEGGETIDDQCEWAYTLATGHHPADESLRVLLTLYRQALTAFQNDAMQVSKINKPAEVAARAIVANAILNLDASLMK